MKSTHKRNSTMLRTGVVLVQLALAGLASTAHAADGDKIFTLSGFGTAAVTHSSITSGDYVADNFEGQGAGYSDSTSASPGSKLAAQLDANITDKLTAVVQVMMRTQPDGDFSPVIEWANVKYAVTDKLSVRLGRTAMPVFMVSQTRHVGFANPWIRPPVESYGLYSLSNSDGIDVTYRDQIGSVGNTAQFWHGKTKVDVVDTSGRVLNDLKGTITGVADSLEYGALTARVGVTQADFTIVPAPGYVVKFKSRVINAGAIYDPGTWFVQGEVSRTTLGGLQRAVLAAYATAGVRIDKWTPYATYSMIKPDDDLVKLPARKQSTVAAGVRWDFMKNLDLKLQIDRVSLGKGSTGMFIHSQPGLAGSSGTVISAAVDFVF